MKKGERRENMLGSRLKAPRDPQLRVQSRLIALMRTHGTCMWKLTDGLNVHGPQPATYVGVLHRR